MLLMFSSWAFNVNEKSYSHTTIASAGAVFVLVLVTVASSAAAKVAHVVFPDHADQVWMVMW